MADVTLYPGETRPADVTLRSFGLIVVALVGIAASPAIGAGTIDADWSSSGVSASAAIGSPSITVTANITGVAASPAVGSFTFNASALITGVAATPAIGVSRIDAQALITGVAASPSIGATEIDVQALISGVAADPEIGTGTVTTDAAGDVTVVLTGVAADPEIGTGTVSIESVSRGIGEPLRVPRRAKPKQTQFVFESGVSAKPITGLPIFIAGAAVNGQGVEAQSGVGLLHVDVAPLVEGAAADPFVGSTEINVQHALSQSSPWLTVLDGGLTADVDVQLHSTPTPQPTLGTGTINVVADLTDDELIALLTA